MPRIVDISLPDSRSASLLDALDGLDDVISIRLQQGVSRLPPGDVVSVTVTDKALPLLLQRLDELGLTSGPETSIATSRPDSIISRPPGIAISDDLSRASWEELESMLNRASGMNASAMASMLLAGMIATFGVLTNALHVVVGAMVIAPGFAPVARMAMGLVSRSLAWQRGLVDTAKAYVSLAAGAVLATWVAAVLGHTPEMPGSSYFHGTALLDYWMDLTAASLLVSIAGALAGGILLVKMQPVLTSGVMIALALIPAAILAGMGLASGRLDLAAKGALRLVIEIGIVAAMTLLVFAIKRWRVERRRSSM